MLGPGGSPPSPQAAMALVDTKGGAAVSGYGRGRAGGRAGGTAGEAPPKKEKSTRAPSAFLLFTKDARPGLAKGLSFAEQQKALSAAWKVRDRREGGRGRGRDRGREGGTEGGQGCIHPHSNRHINIGAA